MRVKILDEFWDLIFVKRNARRKWRGITDASNKQIRIEEFQDSEYGMDTIIHECMHAGNWNLDEVHVATFSSDLAKILTDLGYRRIK